MNSHVELDTVLDDEDFAGADQRHCLDFIEHLDDWLEYLTIVLQLSENDRQTAVKYERQIRYLLRFRQGGNANIVHNKLLLHYYSHKSQGLDDDTRLETEKNLRQHTSRPQNHETEAKVKEIMAEAKELISEGSMSIKISKPIQSGYSAEGDQAFDVIKDAMAASDLYFLQGPPGTGKTTAIVEIILQTLKAKPDARILVTSETHVAVDNALDRLSKISDVATRAMMMRYPKFAITEFESEYTAETTADNRANEVWLQAHAFAPTLTNVLFGELEQGEVENGEVKVPRWQYRNLADRHQIIGVTCNQIDHLIDEDSESFDLVIVDECSKATLPEWIMAMTVGRKCVLVGDHKQLPPTFCEDESEALDTLTEQKSRLIRDGVIDRIFDNLPSNFKGGLNKQFRMLPHIGKFISTHFYEGKLQHHRTKTDHGFNHFGWFTYNSGSYRVPAKQGAELVNDYEIDIIRDSLVQMAKMRRRVNAKERLTIAVITPYRAQSRALKKAIEALDINDSIAVEVDTVDAFQGRQADVVFFSFVRNTGPARFYADPRRMNVAISRARDAVYLVGDLKYIKSKRLPVLDALAKLGIISV